jgi:hypothetical protein
MGENMHSKILTSLGLLLLIFVAGCANVTTPEVTVNDRSKDGVVTVKATVQNRDVVAVPANIPSVIYFEFDSFTIAKIRNVSLSTLLNFSKIGLALS